MGKVELAKLLGLEESCIPDTEVFIDNVIPYDSSDGLSGTKRNKDKRDQFALRYSVSEPFKIGKV